MMSDWTLELRLVERWGTRRYNVAYDLDMETFGERLADEMALGVAFGGPDAFDKTVKVLRNKLFRRDLMDYAIRRLGKMMIDHLEDAEGWHGEDRQERTKRPPSVTRPLPSPTGPGDQR